MSWLLNDPATRFVAQLVVIVALARLLGMVGRRFGQPLVVAEIVAGIVLGPSLFGRVAPGAFAELFPADSLGALRVVSEAGVVLFVFLIGLELDTSLLRGRVRASVLIAALAIATPFVLGFGLALHIDSLAGP